VFLFLLIVQTLVAVALISVILMQRSEGGGLTGGGSPSGMMSARGAADFLTRATGILAAVFVILSIALAALAANTAGPGTIDANAVAPAQPTSGGQLGSAQPAPGGQQAPAPGTPSAIPTLQPQAPAPAQGNQGVPIAQ
jgi:preprotein translocase subunit SecG